METLPKTAADARKTNNKYYFTGKPCKHGHIAKRTTIDNNCSVCNSNRTKQWHKKNPITTLLYYVKRRAQKNNIPFDLTNKDITIPKVCPVLGIPLTLRTRVNSAGCPHDDSPSIDRLIPELGYVKNNIIIVSMKANRIRNNSTIEELNKVSDFYSKILHHS